MNRHRKLDSHKMSANMEFCSSERSRAQAAVQEHDARSRAAIRERLTTLAGESPRCSESLLGLARELEETTASPVPFVPLPSPKFHW